MVLPGIKKCIEYLESKGHLAERTNAVKSFDGVIMRPIQYRLWFEVIPSTDDCTPALCLTGSFSPQGTEK